MSENNNIDKKRYQRILLEHYKAPNGRGDIPKGYATGTGTNPLCGDEICVGVNVTNNTISDIRFNARACSICIASSSIMIDLLNNQSIECAEQKYAEVVELLSGERALTDISEQLKPLSGVITMRSRHKCSLLSWEALLHALKS